MWFVDGWPHLKTLTFDLESNPAPNSTELGQQKLESGANFIDVNVNEKNRMFSQQNKNLSTILVN